jgi:hypothetical protein
MVIQQVSSPKITGSTWLNGITTYLVKHINPREEKSFFHGSSRQWSPFFHQPVDLMPPTMVTLIFPLKPSTSFGDFPAMITRGCSEIAVDASKTHHFPMQIGSNWHIAEQMGQKSTTFWANPSATGCR